MILCDIGNSTVDLYEDGKYTKHSAENFDPMQFSEKIYYVCVNLRILPLLELQENWIDIAKFIQWDKYYPTMGIDRIMVCEAVNDGVIVDAGSAITVDVMRNGSYDGGFISLGLKSAQEAYAKLSSALAESFNFEVDLTIMAKNTPDAITLGFLRPLIHEIERLGKPLYVTGGDSKVFSSFMSNAIVDDLLVFKGMQKLIEKGQLC